MVGLPQLRSSSPNGPSLQHKFDSLTLERHFSWMKSNERKDSPLCKRFFQSDNWIERRWTAGHLNHAIEENRPPPHLSNQPEVRLSEIQFKSNIFTAREIWNWLRVRRKRSVHVTKLTVSEFSDQGTKGVSVREGGGVCQGEGGWREEKVHRGKAFSDWPGLDWRRVFGDLL